MTDSYIGVTEGSDKKLQTFSNTVGGVAVHSEGVTLTTSAGAAVSTAALTNIAGTWGYKSGTNGTPSIPVGAKVLEITAITQGAAASFTINGGDTITLPYDGTDKQSSSITIKPLGNLVAPTIVFTGTDAYFVQYVT